MAGKGHRVNVTFTEDEFEILNFWSKKRGQSLASFVKYLAYEKPAYRSKDFDGSLEKRILILEAKMAVLLEEREKNHEK
jgi:hypothetical protein